MKPSEQFHAAIAEVNAALEALPEETRQAVNTEGLGFEELRAKCRPIMLAGQGRRHQWRVKRIVKRWRDEWMAEIARAARRPGAVQPIPNERKEDR